jgi:ketosteroid isomerase-like protein
LTSRLEEVITSGDRVVVGVRTAGMDAFRMRQAHDGNDDVFTVRDGRVVALRACRDRDDALAMAGIE